MFAYTMNKQIFLNFFVFFSIKYKCRYATTKPT